MRLFVLLYQLLSAPLFCLLAAAAEAAEARQVMSALRVAPSQLVVCSSTTTSSQAAAATKSPASTAAEAARLLPQQGAASVADAAAATTVSVPLMLGLHYTNSGVLSAVCLTGSAVLWPRCESACLLPGSSGSVLKLCA